MRFVFDKEAYSESFEKYSPEERELIRKIATEFEEMVGQEPKEGGEQVEREQRNG